MFDDKWACESHRGNSAHILFCVNAGLKRLFNLLGSYFVKFKVVVRIRKEMLISTDSASIASLSKTMLTHCQSMACLSTEKMCNTDVLK